LACFAGSLPIPIQVCATTHRLDDAAFRQIAFDVMSCVFDIHNEFGRFFDEKIYKAELCRRFPGPDLSHGKLVNMRTELVQHEFVNTKLHLSHRTGFEVRNHVWQEIGDKPLLEWFVAFLRDIGTCLDISMYEDALSHLLGGEERVTHDIEVVSGGKFLGSQKFRLVAPGVAFKVTAFLYEIHGPDGAFTS
jgi:hypothetical protein